jgi:hypothetical protein
VTLAAIALLVVVPVVRLAVSYTSKPVGLPIPPISPASDELSAHDARVLVRLDAHVRRFNAAALPLIRDYNDPTVPAQRWARSAGHHLRKMRTALNTSGADVLTIEEYALRETLSDIVGTMNKELLALEDLVWAMGGRFPTSYLPGTFNPDNDFKRAALRRLRHAAEQRQKLGLELLDQLRQYDVSPPLLEQLQQGP